MIAHRNLSKIQLGKNGVHDNCSDKATCDNIHNNNQEVLDTKTGSNDTDRVVYSMQPTKKISKPVMEKEEVLTNSTQILIEVPAEERLDKPRRRLRRTSDVIDSVGMEEVPPVRPDSPNPGRITPTTPGQGNRRASMGPLSPSSPMSITENGSSSHSTPTSPSWANGHNENAKHVVGDMADAAVVNQKPLAQEHDRLSPGEAFMPVERDAEEYNMNHPRRGLAVIFNHDTFVMRGIAPRVGSDVDVENLQKMYNALGFQVTVHHNKEFSEIRDIINKLAEEDHSDADCLVVTVLSHGLNSDYIFAKDVPYNVDMLWQPFTADKCTTLAGKPKIFFIQACRGEQLDPGINLRRKSRTETDSSSGSSYKIPTHADFLIMYSSFAGFYSWRNPETGTWFIQCLCEQFMNAKDCDLLKLLTRTARKIAIEHESYNDTIVWQHQQKQVPMITSTLIRDVFFRPK